MRRRWEERYWWLVGATNDEWEIFTFVDVPRVRGTKESRRGEEEELRLSGDFYSAVSVKK